MKSWIALGLVTLCVAVGLVVEIPAVSGADRVSDSVTTEPVDRALASEGGERTRRVESRFDIAYGDHGRQRLDVLVPPVTPNRRVVVYFHGGAWTSGDKSDDIPTPFTALLDRGYTLVSANYRLAQDGYWPSPVTDAKSVVRWVQANIDQFGADGSQVVVGGWSAGAHLAAMAAVTAGVWEPGPGDTRVAGAVLYKAIVDFEPVAEAINAGQVDSRKIQGFFGGEVPESTIPFMSVDTWLTDDDPKLYLIAGGRDEVAPAEAMRRLRDEISAFRGGTTDAVVYDEDAQDGHEISGYRHPDRLERYLDEVFSSAQ